MKVFAAVAGVMVLMSSPAVAQANHVGCGDTITADTTLDSDLVNCPNNGIVIGADDITLDLNGHLIDGDGALVDLCPPDESCDNGIENIGRDGVTITGGTVRQFAVGVLVAETRGSQLRRLVAKQNTFPGIVIANSTRSVLAETVVSANGLTTDEAGLVIFGTDHLLLKESTLRANGDIGMVLEGSNANRIIGNTFKRNPETGAMIDGNRNQVAHNRVLKDGDGLVLSGNGNSIRRNFVDRALGCNGGECGIGISFEAGERNLIANNRVQGAKELGIRVASYGPIKGMIVRRNQIRDSGRDGLLVESRNSAVKNTRLRRNHVFGAGGDGIDVGSRFTVVTRNEAARNADLGIRAVRGVIDGGGNLARHNGDARQCTNIACS